MQIKTDKIIIKKQKQDLEIINITDQVNELIADSGIVKQGFAILVVMGSTASISTMEYDPNLIKDFEKALERISPSNIDYEHHKTWGDFNGKSHIRSSIIGPGITVPISNSKLMLGAWQKIVLMDFDIQKREREIIVQIITE